MSVFHSGLGSKERADGLLWQDQEEEDLAECIAAWQENGHVHALSLNRVRAAGSLVPLVRSGVQPLEACGPAISVNVGGSVFSTSSSTLQKAPFFDSLLRHAEGGALGATFDEAGHLFVDRSGELFSYVLGYLRSGHWLLRERARDLEFVDALREEAAFYGLDITKDRLPLPRIWEYATIWQFRDDTSLYVDCLEQTIREDPDHPGLFRLCKYSGGLPLDQQTCTRRFKATSHSAQSVIAYFAMRGFSLQHVVEGSMITHTTSADGQGRCGCGMQYILSRPAPFPTQLASWTPPDTQRG